MFMLLEIALLVLGLLALVTGRFSLTKGKSVRGMPARALGLLAILPLPTAYITAAIVGFSVGFQQVELSRDAIRVVGGVIEVGVFLFYLALIAILFRQMSERDAPDGEPQGTATAGDAPTCWYDSGAPASGKATASMMLGMLSLALTFLASIPAFVLGALALREIRLSQGRLSGTGAAIVGIVLGIFGTFTGAVVLALFVPMLLKSITPVPEFVPAPEQPVAGMIRQPRSAPAANGAVPAPALAAAPAPGVKGPGIASQKRLASAGGGQARGQLAGVGGEALAGPARAAEGLALTELNVDAKSLVPSIVWGDEGRVFYLLESQRGTLRRVALDGFREEARCEVGRPCSWLSESAEGLLLTVNEREVWVIDPKALEVRKRIETPAADRAVSSPALSVAYITARRPEAVGVVDLKTGEIVNQYNRQSFSKPLLGFDKLVVSPDGKYVFAQGMMEQLVRYAVSEDELVFEEASARIAQNGKRIDMSADGSLVALCSGGGNYGAGTYTTFVYKTADLSAPESTIASGPYPQALGFDIKAGTIYAQNHDHALIVYGLGGVKEQSYKLPSLLLHGNSPKLFAVHPDGSKLLILSDASLAFVDRTAPIDNLEPAEASPSAVRKPRRSITPRRRP